MLTQVKDFVQQKLLAANFYNLMTAVIPLIDIEEVNSINNLREGESKYDTLISATNTPRLPSQLLDSKLLHMIMSNYHGDRDNNGFFTGAGKVSFEHTADRELVQMFFKNTEVNETKEKDYYDEDYYDSDGEENQIYGTPVDEEPANIDYRFDYEGEFSRGYLQGNGKLVWNDGLTYEGQFKENLIAGTGRYTWSDRSYYEGGVQEGRRHGNGHYFNAATGATYDGEWKDGERSGFGKLVYQTENTFTQQLAEYYEGEFQHNMRHGKGTMNYKSGNYYVGEWANNFKNGRGIMYWASNGNEKYEGQWLNGLQHGQGVHIYFNIKQGTCNYYEGEFKEGTRCGYGIFYYADGSKYEGQWKKNFKHGFGEYSFSNGTMQRGIFEDDKLVSLIDADGQIKAEESEAQAIQEKLGQDSRSMTNIPLYIEDLVLHSGHLDDVTQIQHVVARHAPKLKQIFQYYSKFGVTPESVKVNTAAEEFKFVASKAGEINMTQFWKFATDCKLIAPNHLTCAKIDRIFIQAKNRDGKLLTASNVLNIENDETKSRPSQLEPLRPPQQIHLHSADNKMRFREFIEAIVRISACYFGDDETAQDFRVSERVNQLIEGIIFKRFDAISSKNKLDNEALFLSQKQEFEAIIHKYKHALQKVFVYYSSISSGGVSLTTNRKHQILPNYVDDITMTVRQFLRMMQLLGFINQSLPLMQVLAFFENQDEEEDLFENVNPHEGLVSPSTSIRTGSKPAPTMRVFPAPRPSATQLKGVERKTVGPELIVEREIIFNEFVEAIIKCAINRGNEYHPELLESYLQHLLMKAKTNGNLLLDV